MRNADKKCSIEGCETTVYARDWCNKHYIRWLKHGDPNQEPIARPTECSIEGCEKPSRGHAWCMMHWKRWKVHGDPNYQRPQTCTAPGCGRTVSGLGFCKLHYKRIERNADPLVTVIHVGLTAVERLWVDVAQGTPDACWPWNGATQANGYGTLTHDGNRYRAHRFAYELLVGPIPEGQALDHLCHDPSRCEGGPDCPHRRCCNPAHMTPVAPEQNNARDRCVSANRRKTHCKRGHAFTPDNTRITSSGSRSCRRCIAIREQQRTEKRTAGNS